MKPFGIPLRIDLSFFLVAGLLGATGGRDLPGVALWTAVVFVSVYVHELGHAFMARAYGLSPAILLHAMGGTTSWSGERPLRPGGRILLSLAGPFAGFAVGAAIFGLSRWQAGALSENALLAMVVGDALWVNLGWGLLNLLPILPLDGGNVMAASLDVVTRGRGRRPAIYVSVALAFLAAGLALWQRQLWIAMLAGWMGASNLRGLKEGARAAPGLGEAWGRATEAVWRGEAEAVEAAARDLAGHPGPVPQGLSAAALAMAARLRKDEDAARSALEKAPPELRAEATVRGWLHLAGREYQAAAAALWQADEAQRVGPADPGLAAALVRSRRAGDALGLARAPGGERVGQPFLRMLQSEAYSQGELETSVEAGRLLFERHEEAMAGYNVACALTRLGREDEAMAWLGRARAKGWYDAEDLEHDPDLAPLRGRPDFQTLLVRKGA